MKKIILLAGLLFSAAISQAQIISLESNDGEGNDIVISDNDVIIFDEEGTNNAKMHFSIQNISNETINIKLLMTAIENGDNMADSGDVQFCFGQYCYNTVVAGNAAPQNPQGVTLAPNAVDNQGYILNAYPGDDGSGVIYDIAFIQVDDEGNQIGENLINFQYKYEPTAGINDFTSLQNIGITVNNTVIKNSLNLTSNLNATLVLFDINGKQVKTSEVVTGSQSIDLNSLNTGIYIAKFTTKENKTSQIRIVKN